MKSLIIYIILISILTLPAYSALSPDDLNQIRLIIKEELNEELKPIKSELSKLKVDVASLAGRVDGVDKMISWLMGVIIVAVGLPQIIVVWRSRKDKEFERRIDELVKEIETLKQQRITNP